MKVADKPIIVEAIFSSPIETVWDAITNIDQMRHWYFENIPEFKPEVGFETKFNVQSDERNFLHIWKITDVVNLRMIKYSWEFEEYPGKSTTAFNITKENDKTLLSLVVEVLEDFPDYIPEFERESCIAGWEYFLFQRLKDFLDKNK